MVRPPITHEAAVAAGIDVPFFNILQGDIVRTSSAWDTGNRREHQSYIIVTPTCDLQPGRRKNAILFPIQPRLATDFKTDKHFATELDAETLFTRSKYFFVPALPDDGDAVRCNLALLDPICTCENEAINLSEPRASLTLFGWRLFGVAAREILLRGADDDARVRAVPL